MKVFKLILQILGALIGLAIMAATAIFLLDPWHWFADPPEEVVVTDVVGRFEGLTDIPESAVITIPAGASGQAIAQILFDNYIVETTAEFLDEFHINPRAAQIGPGTYELPTKISAEEAARILLLGPNTGNRIVVPEGFTRRQIFERIVANTDITMEELEAVDLAAAGLPEYAGGQLEGWLFPATYIIEEDETAESIVSRMITRTLQELNRLGVPEEDRERVLNMASLLEREVRLDGDKPRVARAIMNRLEQNIHLQIDAAVAYGLGISGTELTRAHLQDASNPYNTYVHLGLPPTPISNPGTNAIEAVLNPAEGDWIFWVTVDLDSGETVFTSTYEEHQVYVEQLREWQRANGQRTD